MKHAAKFYLATFGCQMNVYDSNLIASMLEKSGLSQTKTIKEADIILVNTCSVRGGAEERAYARIASMRHYKKQNPKLKIAVVGCMAQNHRDKIPAHLEHVDYTVGPDNYRKLEQLIFSKPEKKPAVLIDQDETESYSGISAKLDSPVSANIAIMRGCNKACSYCIVPRVRGRERSRSPEDIEAEVRAAVSKGVAEVTLLGQTVNSYKHDKHNFSSLIRNLNGIEGLKRIRFTSPHPVHCTSGFIDTMAECSKVCNHIHLPVQSGSSRILKKMRRGYTRRRYLDVIAKLKEAMPGIGITTDIITGFVGEKKEDFKDTLSLVREVRFDSAFMFSYSPREGTPAYAEQQTLTPEEKNLRLQQLIELQNRITAENAKKLVGTTKEILLEGRSRKNRSEWVGKTSCFKKVIIPFRSGMRPGMLVKVNIREIRGNTLSGLPGC